MIRKFAIYLIALLLLFPACTQTQTPAVKGDDNVNDTVKIVRQYYPNKKLKAEISLKDTIRHGITRNFSETGTILSEVMFLNGKRNGKATNYYPDGKVHSVIYFRDNVKIGESTWYYPSGKTYRVTTYVNGKNDGVQKTFYENGKIQAEIPYSMGKKCAGLKEYLENGKPRLAPEVLLQTNNQVAQKGVFTIRISLSNKTRTVKYFLGEEDGSACISGFERSIPSKEGIGIYEISVLRGETIMKKLDIVAVETTSFGNERILHTSYNLALRNR